MLEPIAPHEPDAGRPNAALSDAAPEVSSPTDPHLIHRYSFSGESSEVIDSSGGPSGTLEGGAKLDGSGHLVLDGDGGFVALPRGLISGLSAATVVAWLSWNGGHCWQRVFDFGSNDHAAGAVGNATSSVFATPLRCPENVPTAGPGAVFELSDILGSVDGTTRFPEITLTSIAVAFDPAHRELRLYVAGKRIGAGKFTTLDAIADENDWLGRSQWQQDLAMHGTYDEFRIYDVALDDESLAAIDAAGPNAP